MIKKIITGIVAFAAMFSVATTAYAGSLTTYMGGQKVAYVYIPDNSCNGFSDYNTRKLFERELERGFRQTAGFYGDFVFKSMKKTWSGVTTYWTLKANGHSVPVKIVCNNY